MEVDGFLSASPYTLTPSGTLATVSYVALYPFWSLYDLFTLWDGCLKILQWLPLTKRVKATLFITGTRSPRPILCCGTCPWTFCLYFLCLQLSFLLSLILRPSGPPHLAVCFMQPEHLSDFFLTCIFWKSLKKSFVAWYDFLFWDGIFGEI